MQLPLWPEAASAVADDIDHLYIYLTLVSVVMSVLIFGTIFVFAIKYRRRSEDEVPKPIHGSWQLEVTWSVIPFLVMRVDGCLRGGQTMDVEDPVSGGPARD
jgi:cytochrome c oxidase subunit 2